jgi:predicted phage terminase large subunit-like protein
VFPTVTTDKEHRTVEHWAIAGHRGALLAQGVGGSITGHGAMLGIIDDPFKGWEQAYSPSTRKDVWEWYRGVFRPRVWEGGAIIIINTRWHEDDLCGRLLRLQPDQWTVLRLPAIAEEREERIAANKMLNQRPAAPDPLGRAPGEALAPGRFSRDSLQQIKRDVGSIGWYAEYQGVPRPPEGNLFKRSWLPIVSSAPKKMRYVRYWDKAGTAGGGARTAGVKIGQAENGYFYVADVIVGQWSALEREQIMRQVAEMDGHDTAIWTEQEGGSGGKESAQATVRHLAGFDVHTETVTGTKEIRARPLAAQCEAGNVKLVKGPWNKGYVDELVAFPSGRYADQVDASAGAFNKLAAPDDGMTARAWSF